MYTYFHLWLFWLIRTLLGSKRVLFLSGHLESLQLILPLCLRDLGLEELRALRYWVPDKALVKLQGFLLIPSPFLRENEEGITTVITEIDTFSHENGRSLPSNFAHSNGMRCHYYFVGET